MSDPHDSKRLRALAAMTEGLEPEAALEDAVLLAAAAEATSDLDPGAAFDAAVLDSVEVERLAQRTDDLAPDAAITDAVMARIGSQVAGEAEPRSSSTWPGVVRSARAALVAAAAIAAGTVLYAGYVESTFDSDVMANVDVVEVGDE